METTGLVARIGANWALVVLVLIFIGVVIYVFRPGARRAQRRAAESVLHNQDRPLPRSDDPPDEPRD